MATFRNREMESPSLNHFKAKKITSDGQGGLWPSCWIQAARPNRTRELAIAILKTLPKQ